MQVIKTSENYKIIHDDITFITVEIGGSTMTLQTEKGKYDFTFLNSKPDVVRKVAEMMLEAVKLFLESSMPVPDIEFCKCSGADRVQCRALECDICHNCNKRLPPSKLRNFEVIP